MDQESQSPTQAKRTFQWGISSRDITFLQGEPSAARDGSNCNDCSAISPLPRPARHPEGVQERK